MIYYISMDEIKGTAKKKKKKKDVVGTVMVTQVWSGVRVFYLILAFRIIDSLVVRTYFNPDEYWQSLEVAHDMVSVTCFQNSQHRIHTHTSSSENIDGLQYSCPVL